MFYLGFIMGTVYVCRCGLEKRRLYIYIYIFIDLISVLGVLSGCNKWSICSYKQTYELKGYTLRSGEYHRHIPLTGLEY